MSKVDLFAILFWVGACQILDSRFIAIVTLIFMAMMFVSMGLGK